MSTYENSKYDKSGHRNEQVLDENDNLINVKGDRDTGSINTNLTAAQMLELMENSAGLNFADNRVDYDSEGKFSYVGLHVDANADTSDSEWYVVKVTYTGNNITRAQNAIGSWDDREILF